MWQMVDSTRQVLLKFQRKFKVRTCFDTELKVNPQKEFEAFAKCGSRFTCSSHVNEATRKARTTGEVCNTIWEWEVPLLL